MNLVKLTPVVSSLLMLNAHFFRAGWLPLVLLYLFLVGLLFVRRSWVARLIQISLIIGSIEWIRTLMMYVTARQAMGQPWTRLVLILGAVVLFTALSSLVFQSRTLKVRYKLK